MAKLTAAARSALPSSDFALPKTREYPIQDHAHAVDALARVIQHGTPAQIAQVRAAVHHHFPGIKVRTHDGTS